MDEELFREKIHNLPTNTEKVLALLLVPPVEQKEVATIKAIGLKMGLPEIKNWNVSALLGRAKGRAIKLPKGWTLTSTARREFEKLILPVENSRPAPPLLAVLREHSAKLSNPDTIAFLNEAIGCCETGYYRAAIVLSWAGAVSVLHEFVMKSKLKEFNAEGLRREEKKWREVKTLDGFARVKEHDFLDILEAVGGVSKNVKQELQNNCLQLRNACGHPNNFKVGEHRVSAHLETLIQNVFTKY